MSINPWTQSHCPIDSTGNCWDKCFEDGSRALAQKIHPNQIELLQFDQAGLLTLDSNIVVPNPLENPIEIKDVFFNSDGSCLVSWIGEEDKDQSVCSMIFEQDGKPRYDDPLCTASYKAPNSKAIHHDDGTYTIFWDEGESIIAQKFDQEDKPLGDRFYVSSYEPEIKNTVESVQKFVDGYEVGWSSPVGSFVDTFDNNGFPVT